MNWQCSYGFTYCRAMSGFGTLNRGHSDLRITMLFRRILDIGISGFWNVHTTKISTISIHILLKYRVIMLDFAKKSRCLMQGSIVCMQQRSGEYLPRSGESHIRSLVMTSSLVLIYGLVVSVYGVVNHVEISSRITGDSAPTRISNSYRCIITLFWAVFGTVENGRVFKPRRIFTPKSRRDFPGWDFTVF